MTCPPVTAHWHHLRIQLNLCFLRPILVHNPNGKSIGSAIFAQLMAVLSGMSSPNNCPFAWGIWAPSNTCFIGSTLVHNPNGISISSAIFALITAECCYTLQWAVPLPLKLSLPMGDLDRHLTHDSWGPSEPTTQTVHRSVQPLLHR